MPFQKASAGLDDHPEVWIPHVLTLTQGQVDLSTVSDDAATATTQLRAMCQALPGPGVFVPADALQTAATAFNSSTILAATEPLSAQIADLETLAGQLEAQKAAAERPPLTHARPWLRPGGPPLPARRARGCVSSRLAGSRPLEISPSR